MRRPRPWLLTVLLLALATPAAPAWWPRSSAPVAHAPGPHNLPVVPRGSTEPTAANLPASPIDLAPIQGTEPRYRALRPIECQCLAVQYSSLANLLDRERYELEAARPFCQNTFFVRLFARHCDAKATRL